MIMNMQVLNEDESSFESALIIEFDMHVKINVSLFLDMEFNNM